MAYLAQHLKNVKRKTVVQPRNIESGPIYEIRYKSKTATKSRYLVMALNIYPYTGSEKDKLLHCLDMDYLPLRDLKIVMNEVDGVQIMDVKGEEYLEMKIPDGRENIQFYRKGIGTITRQIPKLYKTLKLDAMSKVEICDYDFAKAVDQSTIRKFGLDRE